VLCRDDYDEFFERRPAMALLLEGLMLNRNAAEPAEAAELLSGDEPTDAHWGRLAKDAAAMNAVCSGHWAF
jgi:hypothetical protein